MTDQDFVIPDWLDKSYLENVLQCDPLGIQQFTVKVATMKGDNFASEIFRIDVTMTDGSNRHLILKKPHRLEEKRNIIGAYDFFPNEMKLYTEYLPKLYEILETVGEFEELAPKLVFCDKAEEVLVMVDLQPEGYRTGDRSNRMCSEAAKVFMRKLAKYHAASMVLNHKLNGALESPVFNMFSADGSFGAVFPLHGRAVVKEVEEWGPEFASIVPKLKKITSEGYASFAQSAVLSKRRGLNVFVHGDLWYTNLLIKKTGDTVEDVIMIDFQLASWASLATDLIYFFFRALQEEDYQNGVDYLIEIYAEHLGRVLKKCKYEKVPTFEDIQGEVRDQFFHVYYSAIICKPFTDAETGEASELVGLTGEEEQLCKFANTFKCPRINKEMQFALKWLDRWGALDF